MEAKAVRQFTDGFAEETSRLYKASDNLLGTPRAIYASGNCNLGEFVYCHPDGGAITVSLPPAVSGDVGRVCAVKHNSDSANSLTIAAYGSDLIDGAATATVAARGRSILIVLSSGSWGVIG